MTQPAARIMMPTGGLRRRLGRPRLVSDESQTPHHDPKPAATRRPGGAGVACEASAAAKQPLDPDSDSGCTRGTLGQPSERRGLGWFQEAEVTCSGAGMGS